LAKTLLHDEQVQQSYWLYITISFRIIRWWPFHDVVTLLQQS